MRKLTIISLMCFFVSALLVGCGEKENTVEKLNTSSELKFKSEIDVTSTGDTLGFKLFVVVKGKKHTAEEFEFGGFSRSNGRDIFNRITHANEEIFSYSKVKIPRNAIDPIFFLYSGDTMSLMYDEICYMIKADDTLMIYSAQVPCPNINDEKWAFQKVLSVDLNTGDVIK